MLHRVLIVAYLTALLAFLVFRHDRFDGPPQEPWIELFDGRSLAGWVTTGGRYDGNARWSVEDGALTGREGPGHAGGLLYTQETYRDFELELRVFITDPFDSGIFVRMRPDARGIQVTLDERPDGEIAGLYADGWLLHSPRGRTHWRKGAWNAVRVRCVGDPMRVTVWVNAIATADYRVPADAGAFAQDGRIGLQVHGARADPPESRVMFKGIRIRRLPRPAARRHPGV